MQSHFAAKRHQLVITIQFGMMLLGIIWTSSFVFAQPPTAVQWTRTIGGTGVEQARAVRQTPDGGFLVAGFANGTGGETGQGSVVKLDANGETVWTRTYGNSGTDWLFALDVLPDGGFVVVGNTMTENSNYESWVIRANATGEPIWTRTFGGWMNDQAYAVTVTSDGGFAVAGLNATMGEGRYLACLSKLNANGELLWQHAWGVPAINVEARSVHECPDGGFIITGGSVSYGEWNAPFNMFVVRTNAHGEMRWTRQYGGMGNEFATDAQCIENGAFVIVGYTTSRGAGLRDICMIRIDSLGNRIWSRTYGGSGNDAAFAVRSVSEGGFVIGGYTSSIGHGNEDLCLLKTNHDGVRQWVRTYGGPGREFPWSNECFQPTADSAYVLAGTVVSAESGRTDMLVIKTTIEQQTSDVTDNWTDAEFVDFDAVSSDVPTNPAAPERDAYTLLSNYPNPFNPSTSISYDLKASGMVTLRVYNLVGQLIATLVNGNELSGRHTVEFNGSKLPSGIYIYAIEAKGFRAQNRMLLLK